jgi:hypothetical protein
VVALKGALIVSLLCTASPLAALELPSLRSPMARYETGSQHYAPVRPASSVALSAVDFSVAALPRMVFNSEASTPFNPSRPFSVQIDPRQLMKSPAQALRWLVKDSSGGRVALGRLGLGYGSVYYDSFYDKPMVFFECKGTRVEEPGCGYLKMSFSF